VFGATLSGIHSLLWTCTTLLPWIDKSESSIPESCEIMADTFQYPFKHY